MSEPIGTAQPFAVRVAKTADECADVFVDLVHLHHLIEVGIDPTILSPHKKDNHARHSFREQIAKPARVIRSKILG